MKQGIKQNEEALESGVTADEYKKNTGVKTNPRFLLGAKQLQRKSNPKTKVKIFICSKADK